jgi:alpha-L-fucosidase 2
MKHLFLLFGLVMIATGPARAADVQERVDWPDFLSRHDLVWNTLPKAWDESAFIGNGLMGATIYSSENNALQWDVGRSDVTDRGNRIAIGRFALEIEGGASAEGTARLDLWNAEARGTLRIGDSEIDWRSFTHAQDPVTVIELIDRKAGAPAKFVFQHLPALPARDEYQGNPIPPEQRNPDPTFGSTDGVEWCLQSFKAGGGYAVAWAERAIEPGRRLFAFTVDYAKEGNPASEKAVADVQAALKTGPSELEHSHRAWWHAYWPQSFLSIPDTRMESFYWIQFYKLASGTRAERPALDLMGPWFRRTPWPRIWWNLNIQLTYWPVYPANRLELGESLIRTIDAGVPNLINNVPEEWRHDSAAIGRSSSYDCARSVSGRDGEERGNLLWALHNYWLHYRHSGDEAMMRDRLYPILSRSVGYYLHLLKPGEDGRLHMPISTSPEYPKKAADTNYDLALLRWGLQTLLATNERFGLNDPLAAKWRETLDKLVPYPVDEKTGYMVGADVPFEESHRHYSHLFMFYPLHVVDPESPADRPLIEKSMDHWLSLKPALRGYSYTGAAAMSAWLGRKNDIVPYLDEFLEFREGKKTTQYSARANTLYTEAGPVVETPLSAAASIHEIVLQSWSMDPFGTDIRIFPAVPDAWKDASFAKLLAEGGFEISAARRDGTTRFVQIKSLAGAPCRVRTGLEEPIIAAGSRDFTVGAETDANGNRITTIDLKKGETVLLTSAKAPVAAEELVIGPVAPEPQRLNFYGSPK